MMNQKFVSKVTEKMKQATIAMVGIGANPEQSTMVASYRDELSFKDIKNKAIGDIMYNFIDENGFYSVEYLVGKCLLSSMFNQK